PAACNTFATSSGERPTPNVLPSFGTVRPPSFSAIAVNWPIRNSLISVLAGAVVAVGAVCVAGDSGFFAQAAHSSVRSRTGSVRIRVINPSAFGEAPAISFRKYEPARDRSLRHTSIRAVVAHCTLRVCSLRRVRRESWVTTFPLKRGAPRLVVARGA